MPDSLSPSIAAARWGFTAPVSASPDAGLINDTYLVGRPPQAVLQWLNPIFAPEVNRDIGRWAGRLREAGIVTPDVLPTSDGALWVDDPAGGCWRALSFVPGATLHRLRSPAQAAAVGALVGRVHAALDGWTPERSAPVRRIHDTPARMAELEVALGAADGHPLAGPARALGAAILADWSRWAGPRDVPDRICHGDLKVSNVRFDAAGAEAVCLIDLDTVGPMDLPSELGDAWRSWCNPAGEDDPDGVVFDRDLFEASARAFLRHGPPLRAEERAGLPGATERICLELAARFCADAVNNSYFREDRARFSQPGAHNLHRARCQHRLARAAASARPFCESVLSDTGGAGSL